MNVERLDDPARFLTAASPFLLEDEARHNLILGLAHTIQSTPDAYPEHSFWLVRRDRELVGAAVRTPPNNLVLARPRDATALEALVDQIDDELPGVIGAVPEVDAFARVWCAHRRATARVVFEQGIFVLRQVTPPPRTHGQLRDAAEEDVELLVEWHDAFTREALGEDKPKEYHLRQIRARLSSPEAGYAFWENEDEVVSLCGFGGLTPNGIRIGPVYTPAAYRGRGYATALTAAVSARLLARGRRFCFLYTDLANPTSNAIYERIGYVRICESRQLTFTKQP